MNTRSSSQKQQQQQSRKQQHMTRQARAIDLFNSIGIDNNPSNKKWDVFCRNLKTAIFHLYKQKIEEYNKKIQEIENDNNVLNFKKFLDNSFKQSRSNTSDSMYNLKKELLVKYGERNFDSILAKFKKNNECEKILNTLKKKYGVTSSNQSTLPSKLTSELNKRHKNLFDILNTIYNKNIGLHHYLGILETIVAFSRKPQLLSNKETPLYLNFTITGLPGTGKSYLAQDLGRILQASGILLYDRFSTLESFDFIGEYIGQSAPRTYNSLLSNLESVVFIDEVYTIARCNADMVQNSKQTCRPSQKNNKNIKCKKDLKCSKFDQYSTEACAEIVKFISENPGCIAVIVAGYEDGNLAVKNTFFKINDGIPRRFPVENRIKMKPIISASDATAKVKDILQDYQLTRAQTGFTQVQINNLYTLFENPFKNLRKGTVLRDNYSSINMMVKEFVKWLLLNNNKGTPITIDMAEEKIRQLFSKQIIRRE